MLKKALAAILCVAMLSSTFTTSLASNTADTLESSEKIKSVDFTQVKITDDFWGARQKMFICKVIPTGIANVEKGGGGIPNIINAAKKNRGESYSNFQGAFYVDSDVHKVLESMCYALQIDPMGDAEMIAGQAAIKAKLDEWIPYYVDAQEADGYFDTYFILGANGATPKWWDFNLHELYIAGHFYEAAVAHYRATDGKDTRLFDVAIKNADYICSLFGEGKWKQVPGHQEIELALVKLANLCQEIGGEYTAKADEYIKMSKFFLDTRGDFEGRRGTNHNSQYDQDHKPVTEQTSAVGHAVRAEYMYTGMADIALLEDNDAYKNALLALWDDVAMTKTYVNGATGAIAANEGFGASFELPNDSAYCETCANIANAFWNQRMNLLFEDSKYIDIVETCMYNSIISCVDFDGDQFFYGNPMSSGGGKHRSDWFGTACCPPNLMRFVESLGGYIYTQKGDEIALNLYMDNEAALKIGGKDVKVTQASDMPWSGENTVTVSVAAPQTFTLKLRVPFWAANGNTMSLNGTPIDAQPDESGYVVLNREWIDGDKLELDFPMEAERVYTDPRVETNLGQTAIRRGPIVYAAENADNEYSVAQYYLPTGSDFTTEWVENLDGKADPFKIKSVMKLSTDAKVQSVDGEKDAKLNFVPYYSWDNRENGAMRVFLPESPKELPLEFYAKPSASFVSKYDTIPALNDGTDARWTAYGGSKNPWVQYDFEKEVTLWNCDVKWYDDKGGVQVPSGLTIEYWDGTAFVPVTKVGEYNSFKANAYNTYAFEPINTTKIRMAMKDGKGAPGITEWKLGGSFDAVDFDNIPLTGIAYGDAPFSTNYDKFNTATFKPVTAKEFRMFTTSRKPVGLRELRVKNTAGEYVEQQATASASFVCKPWSTLDAVNNGLWDDSSNYNGVDDVWSTYPNEGENGNQWVQYTFEEAITLAQADAFWYRAWDDGVVKPASWTFQYLEDGVWKNVENTVYTLDSFDNAVDSYDVILPANSRVPYVSVSSDSQFAKISVAQTEALPGTAVVTVGSIYSDVSHTYTLNFTTGGDASSDVILSDIENVKGTAGTQFTVPVQVKAFPTENEFKSIEGVINVPDTLTVSGVTPNTTSVTYDNFDSYVDQDGKLRFAFINVNSEGTPLVFDTSEGNKELVSVTFALKNDMNQGDEITVPMSRMTFKGSNMLEKQFNVTGSSSTITIGAEKSAAAIELYTGDGVDIIPADKKAVSVVFTGVDAAEGVKFGDVNFYYSPDRSAKTSQVVFVALVGKDVTLDELDKIASYIFTADASEPVVFGNTNKDTEINAADALNVLNTWLRKDGFTPDDRMQLVMNVSCDARLDTTDAIAIVDNFIGKISFDVVTK